MMVWLAGFAALLLLFALALGIGERVQHWLTLGDREAADALKLLWPLTGFAVLAVAGALLNLLHLYSTLGVTIGCAALLALLGTDAVRRRTAVLAATDLPQLGCWLLLAALLSIIPPPINLADDPAYLAYLRKMIALGGSGYEPFSMRRLFTFGGHFPFLAWFLDGFGLRNLALIEPGLAILLTGWLVSAAPVDPVRRRWAGGAFAAFLLYSLFVARSPIVNTLPVLLAVPLVAGAAWAALRIGQAPARRSWFLLLPLLAAAGIGFRPLPTVFLAVLLLFMAIRLRRQPGSLALILLGGTAALLPFMLAMQQASETPFFPYLGSGTQILRPAAVPALEFGTWQLRPLFDAIVPLLLGLVLIAGSSTESRRAQRVVSTAMLISLLAVGLTSAPQDLPRYSFSASAAALLVQLLLADLEARSWIGRAGNWLLAAGPLALAAALAAGLVLPDPPGNARIWSRFAQPALDGAGFGAPCRAAQAAIPAGAQILALNPRCMASLDFQRNPILIEDVPGAAAPLPHLSGGAPGAVLARERIGYAVWDPADAASRSGAAWQQSLAPCARRIGERLAFARLPCGPG